MKDYKLLTKQELIDEKNKLLELYEEYKSKNLKLDMSRGKPDKQLLDLTNDILDVINSKSDLISNGTDTRNYGDLLGIDEARELFADYFDVKKENVMVCGASSLNIMYDVLTNAILYGINGNTAWKELKHIKFLCPVPGYDRHFMMTENFGIEMINIPFVGTDPDIDLIEKLVKDDDSIKGIWCVPKYENPLGVTFSDEFVTRLANMKTKAADFLIMWDNAYAFHDLYEDKQDKLLNIFDVVKGTENENRIFEFASTSKITFAGAGVACLITSEYNLNNMKKYFGLSIISYDKVNMLRHVRYLKNKTFLKDLMIKHAKLLRPKFDIVKQVFNNNLSELNISSWTEPLGGYFITFYTMDGIAKKVYTRCKEAGVTLTTVGAAFPYGDDKNDNCIRIAPSYPTIEELETATNLFTICVRIESIDKLLIDKK